MAGLGRGAWWSAVAASGLLLAGCTGTSFGDQLARSFSAPPAQPPAPKTKDVQVKAGPAKDVQPPAPTPLPQAVKPSRPAPYRITIQLPSADPAAPAEAVTEALRAAGVSFEVEMIERIGAPAPAALPTGPPPTVPPPTVTPAPAPR